MANQLSSSWCVFPWVVRLLSPEIPAVAPQVQGAKGEVLVEPVEIVQGAIGGIREGDTAGETLPIINSSSKATDLVSFTDHTLLIYVHV